MDESGLRQLLDTDVVLSGLFLFPLGWLYGARVVSWQNDVAWAFASALCTAAFPVPSMHLAIQLLEELTVADVDGLSAGQLRADRLCGTFLSAHCQSVAGVVGHILQVNLGHAGRHGVEVGALLKGESTGGGFLFPLEGRALRRAWIQQRGRESV